MFSFSITRIGPLQLKLWSISHVFRSLGCLLVCVRILGLVFGADFVLILGLKLWIEVQDCLVTVWGQMCGLSMACLWLGFGLDLDSLGVVLCSGGGMFVCLVMAVCVDSFVGISYATIGLEN